MHKGCPPAVERRISFMKRDHREERSVPIVRGGRRAKAHSAGESKVALRETLMKDAPSGENNRRGRLSFYGTKRGRREALTMVFQGRDDLILKCEDSTHGLDLEKLERNNKNR